MVHIFCGVEGGATNTTLVVLNERCEVIGRAAGGCSNHYLTSLPAVAALLAGLARDALASAGFPAPAAPPAPLFRAFGACMSGFLAEGPQRDLEALFRSEYPWLAESYYIDNDSPGSIFTAAKGAGGCVIIAGTGSMGQLMLPTGEVFNCGGHGHAYGDEGSAYSIAATAIRLIFAAADGFDPQDPAGYADGAPLGSAACRAGDTGAASRAMLDYFSIEEPSGMLNVMYGAGFQKDRVAGFAKALAALALGGDAFSSWVFAKAGRELGANLRALVARAPPTAGALAVVAVGSVWKSWPLLRDAFVRAAYASGGLAGGFRLLRLRETSAVGAGWRAAQRAGVELPLDTGALTETLFESAGRPQ